MPKFAACLIVVYSLLILSVATPVRSQVPTKPDEKAIAENLKSKIPADALAEPEQATKKVDLKKAFDEETKKFKAESAKFDPVKVELAKAKQAQKNGWSKTETWLMVAFAAGIAVLVWLVIKYGKDCVDSNPPDCNPVLDEFCTCERYEERK